HPLQGVEIKVKGSAVSVISDTTGSFKINISQGATLVFSHLQFNAKEVQVTSNSPLIIKLEKKYLQAPDSVNVLYETKQANKILGSVSTIYTNQLTTTAAPLYAYALAGRLPGLYTQQTRGWAGTNSTPITAVDFFFGEFPTATGSTGPNDNTEFLLRVRGQKPVTIIDGVQRDIYTLNPENIESISVLKDALSTILLGINSSRGVILVTTKKPIPGTPHVSFTAQTGIQTPLGLPDPIPSYQYAYLYNEALLNEDNNPAYDFEDFKAYRTHSDPYGHPDVNWFNTILKNHSLINSLNLNVSGGGNAARYSVGLGYLDQEGLFGSNNSGYNTNTQIQRYTINTNIDVNVTRNFTAQLQIFARIQDGNQPGATTDGIIGALYTTPNNAYPVFNPDGSLGGSQSYSRNIYGMVNNSGYIQDYTKDVVSNLILTYKLDKWIKGLWAKAQTNLSVYGSNAINRSSQMPSFKFAIDPNGDTTYSRFGSTIDQSNTFLLTYSAQFWYLQTALGYAHQFGVNNFSAKLFYDRYESIFNYDLPKTNQTIAATASYDYANKYFAEAAINYSGNDRYPPGKQFGFFYAAGLGWDAAQEKFIKNNTGLKWINKIKLRITYGKTGNDNVGYFTWRPAYSSLQLSNNTFDVYTFGSDRTRVNGLSQDRLANPNVTWEKANKLNLGIDISILKNHLQFTAEYYNNRYYDLLQQRGKQSAIIGIAYPSENIGINRYMGTELSLTYQNNYKNLNYFITANASAEQTKVIYMDEIEEPYPWMVRTGLPVGEPFGYIAEGFIQTQQEAETSATIAGYTLQPGDIKLKDLNGDGVINNYDQTSISTTKPLIYYGITAGFSFKGFDLSVLLQGVENRRIILTDPSFGITGKGQAFTYIVGRWTPETATTATYPRLTPGYNANNDINPFFGGGSVNTFWVHSGNYFRIKNVDVGYTIPYKLTNRVKISSLRVFINGLNLFTHAKFDRVDPEVSGQVYPIQRVINFGINVKF
ncbi:MAG: SusC/RagA family TonB-linked outer membrane protein, partial [Parafilimonas sp.]